MPKSSLYLEPTSLDLLTLQPALAFFVILMEFGGPRLSTVEIQIPINLLNTTIPFSFSLIQPSRPHIDGEEVRRYLHSRGGERGTEAAEFNYLIFWFTLITF
ncbi:hypothetical protein O6P43_025995 [Quillaja saponaria]|uniref:Uncharacterized protein n=1 Tax=Quillaja saponaria TaxID=32244 RepID=A0AAD7LAF2_QUISA|nr:hypothetical protein O6P43_025995 [Quillaja saponaria]